PLSLLFSHRPATPELSALSLHDALPILTRPSTVRRRTGGVGSRPALRRRLRQPRFRRAAIKISKGGCENEWSRHRISRRAAGSRSEEHTSELQSRENLVCRLLLEKKKKK